MESRAKQGERHERGSGLFARDIRAKANDYSCDNALVMLKELAPYVVRRNSSGEDLFHCGIDFFFLWLVVAECFPFSASDPHGVEIQDEDLVIRESIFAHLQVVAKTPIVCCLLWCC